MAIPILGWAILAGAALLGLQHAKTKAATPSNSSATGLTDVDPATGSSVAPVVSISTPVVSPAATTTPVRDFVITPAPMQLKNTDPLFAIPTLVTTGATVPLAHENIISVQDPLRFRALTQE